MGNINTIPVLSQIKSLFVVIGGDEQGAREIQKEFARKGIIASQISSLVAAIKDDPKEAKKIQEEFAFEFPVADLIASEIFAIKGDKEKAEKYAKEGATLSIGKGIPIVGHGIAAGYAIAGDLKEAEKVALGATKTTVVAAASAAGLLCGPGAPACMAALGTGSSVAWDGAESGVRGKSV